ncbi:MAG TPA: XrtA system polysaccharide chain length determinant [Steroidobacteraceae bacterium]|jgi:polysaccharide chain length determinant protein (PEP-CTERM system associated)|nr:XrtA system polysaccharide chain length determinant [Steroidobacteraceae bacterium]
MKQELERAIDEVRGAWRFRWFGLTAAFVVAFIGWGMVFALKDRYEAEARVFVDTRTALKPALQGLTTDQNVDAQINYVRQSLLEGPQLERIAKETGVLDSSVTDERARRSTLDRLSNRIALTVFSAGNQGDERSTAGSIYNFHYTDVSRDRALKVVKTLVNTFVDETLGGKREGSEQAQQFLEAQIKDYEQRLSSAEDRLAAFKKTNVGLMPSEQGGYFAQLQNEVDAEKKAETNLSIAMSRRDELAKQLHSDEAITAAGVSAPVGVGGRVTANDTLSRIQEAQAKLDELLLKYTDRHPDVIAARATLDELKKRRATELESLKRGDASAVASSGAGNNPVYQNIQLDLNKEDVEIAALRREVAQHQSTVAELRQRLNSAPQVEAEFQQLNRDYDVNKAQYTALLESYQKARLGERADNAGSVRFEVVVPPTAPVGPVSPKRNVLLAIIWLAAMGVGAGLAYILSLIKPIISSVRTVNELTSFPVLGVVSSAFPSRQKRQFRKHLLRFSAASVCLTAAFIGALWLNWSGARLTAEYIRALVKT